MINQRVEGRAHAQADDSTGEEAAKRSNVARRRVLQVPRVHHAPDVRGAAEEQRAAYQVAPDVDALVVQVQQGLGGVQVRGRSAAVRAVDEGVVAAP